MESSRFAFLWPSVRRGGPLAWWGLVGCLAGDVAAAGGEITYARDIAPLLNRHCVACHRPGGPAPFSLIGHEAARKHARAMGEVTLDRYMPPWKPEPGYGPPLRHARSLTETEITLFGRWAASGAAPGDLTTAPPPPPPPVAGWTLGTPDLVLEFPEAYEVPAAGKDIYRNFVLSVPLERPRYVRALEFLPEAPAVVHHAVFALDRTPASRARDQADPGPGFSSMDLGRALNPEGHIIGWTPGQVPYEVHPGTAWPLQPGTDLIVQLHLLPAGRPVSVRSKIGLYFTDTPPERTSTVVQLRAYDIDIPAGATDYRIEERLTLPVAAQVLGLYPHAHYLGKDLRIDVELPNGGHQPLLRIPDWDFAWQSDYRYEEPLSLPAGAQIVMRYTYDNSAANPRNPSQPPQRVRAGWSSLDEMGEVAVQLLLAQPADRLRVDEAQARYDLARGAASATSWYNLAVALDYQGRAEEARPAYEQALAMDPGLSQAANNLAAILERKGETTQAEAWYRRALADPAQAEARLNLAKILRRQRQPAEAKRLLGEVLAQQPGHFRARVFLADLLMAERDAAGAVTVLEAGRKWHEDNPQYRLQLGKIYAVRGAVAQAREHLIAATRLTQPGEDGHPDAVATARTRAEAHYTLALFARQSGDQAVMKAELAATLAEFPDHFDARLLVVINALTGGAREEAARHLAHLVRLPAARQMSAAEWLGYLPFPEGPILLIRACEQAAQAALAREIRQLAWQQAGQAGRPDWQQRLLPTQADQR